MELKGTQLAGKIHILPGARWVAGDGLLAIGGGNGLLAIGGGDGLLME